MVVPEKQEKTASDSVTFVMTPVTRICEYYNGKYYGKDGKETTELKYKQECETNICIIIGDKYFGKDGKETTELEYRQQCETNICKIVGDKYFGKDGKETTESEYKAQCETPIPNTGVSPLSTILSVILGSGIIGGTVLLLRKYSKNN